MDSNQQLTSMDPKLREAYERIMGAKAQSQVRTAAPAGYAQPSQQTDSLTGEEKPLIQDLKPVTPPAQAPEAPPAPAAPVHDTAAVQQSAAEETSVFAPAPEHPQEHPAQESAHHEVPVPVPPHSETPPVFDPVVANNQMHAYVSQEVAGAKQSIKTIQLIYVIGGLVFFLVYALFWMKFFNVASPF